MPGDGMEGEVESGMKWRRSSVLVGELTFQCEDLDLRTCTYERYLAHTQIQFVEHLMNCSLVRLLAVPCHQIPGRARLGSVLTADRLTYGKYG